MTYHQHHTYQPIAQENYLLAFRYLDRLFFRVMDKKTRASWDYGDGLGPLIRFYSELIQKLPYDNKTLFQHISLNHSPNNPLTYDNRQNLTWIIHYRQDTIIPAPDNKALQETS